MHNGNGICRVILRLLVKHEFKPSQDNFLLP